MLFNFVFAFMHGAFDGALVEGVIFQPIDSDGPFVIVESTLCIVVVDDGINGAIDNAVSLSSFVSATLVGVLWL